MSDGDLNLAKQAIGNLLQLLSITKVVYVDDVFEEKQDVEKVIGWVAEAHSKSPSETNGLLPEVPLDAPEEVWRPRLRSHWESLAPDTRKEIVVQLSRISGNQLAIDFETAGKMKSLFPRRSGYAELSPSLWEEQKDSILSQASAKAKILCLFDQNITEISSSIARTGIGLIQDVMSRDTHRNVICGLVTHTIPSLENEMPAWRDLAAASQLGLDQFLPLAKIRLASDASPLLFADGIKKTVLNTFCESLKTIAARVLEKAHEDAMSRLHELDVYDFDYMILQASFSEGEWEANTMVRVFRIFQQDAIQQMLLEPSHSDSFNKSAAVARSVSAIRTIGNDSQYPWNARRIRHQELYEEANLIRHSPLQVGDVFELLLEDGERRTFVALAQPCDLMVRRTGVRDNGDNIIVPLAPVVSRISWEDAEKKRQSFFQKQAFLHYFYSDSNDVAVVRFADTYWIGTDVLDLAVLSEEGICRLDTKTQQPTPPSFTVGWAEHVKKVIERFSREAERLDRAKASIAAIGDDDTKEAMWQSMMPKLSLTDPGFPSESYSDGVFDFRLRRVKRCRQPGAGRLLTAFTRYLSRDADEHDFARPGLFSC